MVVILSTFAYGAIKGAPYIPTRKNDVTAFIKLANIKPGDRFIDMGSGDGRLLFTGARLGAIATGYEISLIPYIISKLKLLFFSKKKFVKIHYSDFWNKDLGGANIVYCFLMPKFYDKLKAKLTKELKPGTKVIAYVWPIPDWEITAEERSTNSHMLYLYTMK